MGAEFCLMSVKSEDRKEVKKQFEAEQDRDRYENGHSYSGGFGMADGIEFTGESFSSYDEAEAHLEKVCEKWGPAIAVRFQNKKGELNYLIGALCSC
jgi:hypothetical protein